VRRRHFITLLGGFFVFLCMSAEAQEGYYGVGHDKWHQGFYSKLKRNDGRGSCCNLMDCRPTQSRMVGEHYEVKVDGVWTPVPYDKINNVVAPDGGAHVCAPRQVGPNKGVIFCVHRLPAVYAPRTTVAQGALIGVFPPATAGLVLQARSCQPALSGMVAHRRAIVQR
jgi:hypothetical protein